MKKRRKIVIPLFISIFLILSFGIVSAAQDPLPSNPFPKLSPTFSTFEITFLIIGFVSAIVLLVFMASTTKRERKGKLKPLFFILLIVPIASLALVGFGLTQEFIGTGFIHETVVSSGGISAVAKADIRPFQLSTYDPNYPDYNQGTESLSPNNCAEIGTADNDYWYAEMTNYPSVTPNSLVIDTSFTYCTTRGVRNTLPVRTILATTNLDIDPQVEDDISFDYSVNIQRDIIFRAPAQEEDQYNDMVVGLTSPNRQIILKTISLPKCEGASCSGNGNTIPSATESGSVSLTKISGTIFELDGELIDFPTDTTYELFIYLDTHGGEAEGSDGTFSMRGELTNFNLVPLSPPIDSVDDFTDIPELPSDETVSDGEEETPEGGEEEVTTTTEDAEESDTQQQTGQVPETDTSAMFGIIASLVIVGLIIAIIVVIARRGKFKFKFRRRRKR